MAALGDETSSMGLGNDVLASVRELSSQFFADAADVDSAAMLPAKHVSALASAGMYGIFAPVANGGLGLDYAGTCAVVEELASSCLATTFVWVQHFRFLGAMVDPTSPAKLRKAYLAGAVRGEVKGGVALTGLLPGPARLSARPAPGGWQVDGEAPWVSGWGIVDLVFLVARGPGRDSSFRSCSTAGRNQAFRSNPCDCRPQTPVGPSVSDLTASWWPATVSCHSNPTRWPATSPKGFG